MVRADFDDRNQDSRGKMVQNMYSAHELVTGFFAFLSG